MGSGYSGIYSGTHGGSQPYAETYSVVSSMMALDKKDADIYDPKKGYFKNPLAASIEDAIQNGKIYMNGHKANGPMTYVLDENGSIIFAKRHNPNDEKKRSPHPTLIGGKNPKVQCAGIITFEKGKIVAVDDRSGHFRPNAKSLEKVEAALDKLYDSHPELFSGKSKWRRG